MQPYCNDRVMLVRLLGMCLRSASARTIAAVCCTKMHIAWPATGRRTRYKGATTDDAPLVRVFSNQNLSDPSGTETSAGGRCR
jgi:hypothetical protein